MNLRQLFTVIMVLLALCGSAQKYMTKTGYVYFKSHTDAIDIDGSNNKVAAMFDASSGEIVAIVLIKAFELPLATADKHFNEVYMESDDYPKATFKGKFVNLQNVDINSNETQELDVEGVLSLHGVDKPFVQKVNISNNKGKLSGTCSMKINIDDFGITVPENVKDRVAKVVDVKVELTLEEVKK
ncbi:MAG: YceI family protein [Prolixibacteraceae bacterium]|nr:YceI family protein [Prolixibacteraceae bacterium]